MNVTIAAQDATRPGVSEAVARMINAIRIGIRDGRWVPGQRLVEVDLSEEFRVQRGAVREALRILSGDGLIELIRNRGARIRRVSAREAAQIQQVLGALKFAADLLTARRLGQQEVVSLFERSEALEAAVRRQNKADIMHAAAAYQMRCNELSGNPYIAFAMQRINIENLTGVLAGAMTLEVLVLATSGYSDLTRALAAGDSKRAREIMNASYEFVIRTFSAKIDEAESSAAHRDPAARERRIG